MTKRILIVVHCAANEGPLPDGGTEHFYSRDDYDRMAIGNAEAMGRLLHALWLAEAFVEARLYIIIPPDELKYFGNKGFANLHERAVNYVALNQVAVQNHRIDANRALAFLRDAKLDLWEGHEADKPQNTATEAERATAYALEHGFDAIQPVSTGWGHAARCGATDFGLAEKTKGKVLVPGYASQPFPGLKGQQSALVDPPHQKNAPFAKGVQPEWQLHKLIPALFRMPNEDWPMFLETLAGIMRQLGIKKNSMGEEI